MVYAESRNEVEVPEGVNAQVDGVTVTIQGPNGTLQRTFRHQDIRIEEADGGLVVAADYPRRKVRAIASTWASHLRNMVRGSQEDFVYQMRIVYSHFPIKARVQTGEVVIENFLGERFPRRARILGETKVQVKGEDVTLQGPDLEAVSQSAANIEQATRIRGYDPRVFQDGIYITVKGK